LKINGGLKLRKKREKKKEDIKKEVEEKEGWNNKNINKWEVKIKSKINIKCRIIIQLQIFQPKHPLIVY
jgi:hypothetical protein